MQVALYARVSSACQEQERTIASQVEALEAYAAAHAYAIVPDGRFYDDGRSGARLDRPALDALRDAARLRAFDAVLIHHPDRLARNYAYQVVLLEEFQQAGVAVIFLEQCQGPVGRSRLPPAGADPRRGGGIRAHQNRRAQPSWAAVPPAPRRGRPAGVAPYELMLGMALGRIRRGRPALLRRLVRSA